MARGSWRGKMQDSLLFDGYTRTIKSLKVPLSFACIERVRGVMRLSLSRLVGTRP